MGKRDKRVAFMNPIAAARARGPAQTSGPSIKDYLGRNRMSLEEAEEKILKSTKQGGSGSLAAWEQELNDNYKKELKKVREKKLAAAASPSSKKKKKKKGKKQARARSRSHSPSLSDSGDAADKKKRKRRKEKRKKRRKRHQSRSEDTHSDESEEESEAESSRRRKRKPSSLRDGRESSPPSEAEAPPPQLREGEERRLLSTSPLSGEQERTEQKTTKWTKKWDVTNR